MSEKNRSKLPLLPPEVGKVEAALIGILIGTIVVSVVAMLDIPRKIWRKLRGKDDPAPDNRQHVDDLSGTQAGFRSSTQQRGTNAEPMHRMDPMASGESRHPVADSGHLGTAAQKEVASTGKSPSV